MSIFPAQADESTAAPGHVPVDGPGPVPLDGPMPVDGPAPAEDLDYPRGLIPPSKRGRSQSLIGDIVVDLGFARRDDVETAVTVSREQGRTTGQQLLEQGHIRQDQLARALAERFGLDYVDLSVFDVDMGAASLVTLEVAKRYAAVPVGFLEDGTVILAMADPTNVLTVDEISMITGMKVKPAAAGAQDVSALISRLNRFDDAVAEIEAESEPETELKLSDAPDSDAPIVKLVHSIIGQAVEQGASDIHFDPEAGDMKVQFRVDGVLAQAATIARRMAAGVISRIKIMANLDIAEKRLPQDGRLAVTVDGRRIDVRVVTLPLVKGEGVVMRILDTRAVVRELESLGMQDSERKKFVAAVTKPYGAVLVTGPTGSGKSTTLYGALSVVNDGEKHILTIEDPVESQIAGIKQMQVSVEDRRHLRDRPALDAARRPRRDHGRRDPRPRDRRDRNPGRAHRPPRVRRRCTRAMPPARWAGSPTWASSRSWCRPRSTASSLSALRASCAPTASMWQTSRTPSARPTTCGASSFTSRWAACGAATPAIRVASASTRSCP